MSGTISHVTSQALLLRLPEDQERERLRFHGDGGLENDPRKKSCYSSAPTFRAQKHLFFKCVALEVFRALRMGRRWSEGSRSATQAVPADRTSLPLPATVNHSGDEKVMSLVVVVAVASLEREPS